MAKKRLSIVGGGISGLTCAYWLKKHAQADELEITIYERAPELGGRIKTVKYQETVVEMGAEYFRKWDFELMRLIYELGLKECIRERKDTGSLFTKDKRLVKLNSLGLFLELGIIDSISFTSSISRVDKGLRAVASLFSQFSRSNEISISRFISEDTMFREWVEKKYGDEIVSILSKKAYENLLRPILNAHILSKSDDMNLFSGMALAPSSFASYFTIDGGLCVIIEKLHREMHDIVRLDSGVQNIEIDGQRHKITLESGEKIDSDVVVWSAPQMCTFLRNYLNYRNKHHISSQVFLVDGKLKTRLKNNGGIIYVDNVGGVRTIRNCEKGLYRIVADECPNFEEFFDTHKIIANQYWQYASALNFDMQKTNAPKTSRMGLYVIGDNKLPTMNMAVIEGKKVAEDVLRTICPDQ